MSMYGDYIREHRGDGIVEYAAGFATYRFLNNKKTVYIVDIYVKPDFRNSKVAANMADEICELAKKEGAVEVIGTVVPSAYNSTESVKVLIAYGMKLSAIQDGMIVFRKDL